MGLQARSEGDGSRSRLRRWRVLAIHRGRFLRISTCVERHWVDRSYRYTLRQNGPIDVEVAVEGNDAPFKGVRRIRITEADRKLTIRTMSPSKAIAQEDLVLSRSGN